MATPVRFALFLVVSLLFCLLPSLLGLRVMLWTFDWLGFSTEFTGLRHIGPLYGSLALSGLAVFSLVIVANMLHALVASFGAFDRELTSAQEYVRKTGLPYVICTLGRLIYGVMALAFVGLAGLLIALILPGEMAYYTANTLAIITGISYCISIFMTIDHGYPWLEEALGVRERSRR